MSRHKLKRFAINAQRRNIIEPGKELYEKIKGQWHEYFGNQNEIVLELGCGRGEYTVGLATHYPQQNFIGVDIKGSRIWKGSTIAVENNLNNAAFLRTMIQNIPEFFEQGEVNEIWITFPDPRPRGKDEKRRLTSPRFMQIYKQLFPVTGGWVKFKTDNRGLFDYTLEEVLKQPDGFKVSQLEYTFDLYNSQYLNEHFGLQTTYEKKYLDLGVPINYLKFYLS